MIHRYTLEVVFDHFVAEAQGKYPTGVTARKLGRMRSTLINTKEYSDELLRHGINTKSVYKLRDTDSEAYQHLLGNFWSMVCERVGAY
jgi:hypothetical protein